MNIIPSDYLFEFKSFQFSAKLCSVMIIDKALSQSLQEVGTDLKEECFSHMCLSQKSILQKVCKYWNPQEKRCLIFIIKTYIT
jgi:hypothetical protein